MPLTGPVLGKCLLLSYIHTRQPTNPRPMPTNLWLGRVWSGKKLPALIEERIYDRSTPLYPRCIPDAPTLKSRSSRPTPVLPADQSLLCTTNRRPIPDATSLTTLNIGPTPDLISTPGLKWMPTVLCGFSTRNAHIAHIVKGTWTRLGPMFVYKNYVTWNLNRILTESHPKMYKPCRKMKYSI